MPWWGWALLAVMSAPVWFFLPLFLCGHCRDILQGMGNAGYTIKDGEATIDASWEEVNVSGKNLTSIAFKNLDNARIVKLYLGNNKLTSLPAEIGMLTGLERLDLDNNQLTSLPVEFGRLTGLMSLRYNNNNLSLDNNPLTTPPMEVCKEGTTAIRAYFLEHQAHSSPDEENPKAKTTQPAQQEGLVSSHGGLPSYDEAVLPAPDDDAPPSYDQLMMDENNRVGSM